MSGWLGAANYGVITATVSNGSLSQMVFYNNEKTRKGHKIFSGQFVLFVVKRIPMNDQNEKITSFERLAPFMLRSRVVEIGRQRLEQSAAACLCW